MTQEFSLRDLIYGSQPTQDMEEDEDDYEKFESDGKKISYRPLGQVYTSFPKKRKYLGEYSRLPAVTKKSHTFPPGTFAFQKFQQYERPSHGVNREVLRSLWNQACYGGDLDAAVRILNTMTQVDSVGFSDFHQFLMLLRSHSQDSLSNISLMAYNAISSKVTTPNSTAARSILEMFIGLLITHPQQSNQQQSSSLSLDSAITNSSVVNKTIDLINRFILTPSITGDSHLESLLTLLYCLQAVEICVSLVSSKRSTLPAHPSLAERYAYKKHAKHQRNLVNTISSEKGTTDPSSLSPSCAEICASPLRFADTIATLRTYEAKFSKKFGSDRRIEVRRILHDIGSHFDRTFRLIENKSKIGADFKLLYVAYLFSSGKSTEAAELLSSGLPLRTRRGRRSYLHFIATTAPSNREALISAAKGLLFPQTIFLSTGDTAPSPFSCGTADPPDLEDLSCACHLYRLGELGESDFIQILANAVETSSPSTVLRLKEGQVRNSGNIDVIFETNFQILHHSLWANLATLLGPYDEQHEKETKTGREIHGFFDQINSETLKAKHGLPRSNPRSITLDFFRNYSFNSQYFDNGPKHQCQHVNLFQKAEAQETQTEDCSPHCAPEVTSEEASDLPPRLKRFRTERKWWAESGQVFCSSFLGEELSWTLMEFIAEKTVLTALRRHSSLAEAALLHRISEISFDKSIREMSQLKSVFDSPSVAMNKDLSPDSESGEGDSDDSSDLSSQPPSPQRDSDNDSDSDGWGDVPSSKAPLKYNHVDSSDEEADASEADEEMGEQGGGWSDAEDGGVGVVGQGIKSESDGEEGREGDVTGGTDGNQGVETVGSMGDSPPEAEAVRGEVVSGNENEDVHGGGTDGTDGGPGPVADKVRDETEATTEAAAEVSDGDSRVNEEHWESFLLWCQSKAPPYASSSSSSDSPALGPFAVQKTRRDLSSTLPLWSILSRVYGLRQHSSGPSEQQIHFLLGDKLLEILAYQILVFAHLTGDCSQLWISRAVQVLFLQVQGPGNEPSPAALRCLAYLMSMGIDVMEIVRQGNASRALNSDLLVKPADLIDAPEEQVLHSSSAYSYSPL